MKKIVLLLTVALAALPVFAQETEPDPAVQAAKEEVAVVYDLGRFFGYVWGMQQEGGDLALTRDQMSDIYEVASEVAATARIEPDWAEDQLDYLELDVLSPAQLMQVDMLALAREESRVEGSGTGSGGGSGSGVILSYVDGGPFNPITGATNTIGTDFAEFMAFLQKELGR